MVKNFFTEYFTNKELYSTPNNTLGISHDLIYEKLKEKNYNLIKNSFNLSEISISQTKYDVNFSGTTSCMVFFLDNKIICANAGDSRAILISSHLDRNIIIPLSRDHKPELKDELHRITRSNGRVDKLIDNGVPNGPFRVWLKNDNFPGLAMSRSIGDLVAGSVGVICDPEIIEYKINESSKFIVVASDGIWEYLTNERVAEIVNPFYNTMNAIGAVEKLVEEASMCWNRVNINYFLFLIF